MSSFTDQFNRQFQDSFLAHALRDDFFLSTVATDVTPDLFPDETTSRLVRIILDFYQKEHSAPGTLIYQVIDQDLGNKVLMKEQHTNLGMLLEELFDVKLQNRQYLISMFSDFCRVQKYRAELPRIPDLLKVGSLDSVDAILADLLAYRAGQDKKWGRFWSAEEMPDRVDRRKTDNSKRLYTFVPELDEIVSGIGPGNINLIQSRQSSDGKTAFLCMLARSFAFQNANVLIFTIGDMTEEEYEDRLDMCFAGLTRDSLARRGDVLAAQKRMSKFHAKIHVKELPAGITTVSCLQDYTDRLEAKSNFRPDVLIIDYADCIGPETASIRGNLSAVGAEVFQGLKHWMQTEKLRCWTAGQSGRQASDVEYAEQSHIAGSIEKVRIVDTIVSITRDTQEETNIKITKSRHDGARGRIFTIPTDFCRMQFYDGKTRRE